jgi:MFS-type transporter involved in bile tolerance (Atg22 family)
MTLTTPSITASTPFSAAITNNPALDSLILKGLTILATWAALWIASHLNMNDPNFIYWLTGTLTSVLALGATAIWGVLQTRLNQVKAVTAGMNLVAADAAIKQISMSGTTFKPVTPASAAQIVKDFGHVTVALEDEPALTDKLNASQLPSK